METIINYEIINGTRSEKKTVSHQVETLAEVKAFKSFLYEKEKIDPKEYDIVFWFSGTSNYDHLLYY